MPQNPPLFDTSILVVLNEMKNNGLSEATIEYTQRSLTILSRHTTLTQPEAVKQVIANLTTGKAYKLLLTNCYDRYCKHYKIQWDKPKYKAEQREITLPTDEKLNMLISAANRPLSTKLKISMETGLRPIELSQLRVKDIDRDSKTIHPATRKNGAARTLKISSELLQSILQHIQEHNLKPEESLFGTTPQVFGKAYRHMRLNLSRKLNDPSLNKIRLYDFRHAFCMRTVQDKQDPYVTMYLMGHKKLDTTQKYMHLSNYLENLNGEWTCRAATTIEEATKLIEAGFQYVTAMEGVQLFKKRK